MGPRCKGGRGSFLIVRGIANLTISRKCNFRFLISPAMQERQDLEELRSGGVQKLKTTMITLLAERGTDIVLVLQSRHFAAAPLRSNR